MFFTLHKGLLETSCFLQKQHLTGQKDLPSIKVSTKSQFSPQNRVKQCEFCGFSLCVWLKGMNTQGIQLRIFLPHSQIPLGMLGLSAARFHYGGLLVSTDPYLSLWLNSALPHRLRSMWSLTCNLSLSSHITGLKPNSLYRIWFRLTQVKFELVSLWEQNTSLTGTTGLERLSKWENICVLKTLSKASATVFKHLV